MYEINKNLESTFLFNNKNCVWFYIINQHPFCQSHFVDNKIQMSQVIFKLNFIKIVVGQGSSVHSAVVKLKVDYNVYYLSRTCYLKIHLL